MIVDEAMNQLYQAYGGNSEGPTCGEVDIIISTDIGEWPIEKIYYNTDLNVVVVGWKGVSNDPEMRVL